VFVKLVVKYFKLFSALPLGAGWCRVYGWQNVLAIRVVRWVIHEVHRWVGINRILVTFIVSYTAINHIGSVGPLNEQSSLFVWLTLASAFGQKSL